MYDTVKEAKDDDDAIFMKKMIEIFRSKVQKMKKPKGFKSPKARFDVDVQNYKQM